MERLEEIVDRVRGHDRTGVGDGERRAAVCGPGGNFDPTTGLVVFERVVHEVRHKAFGEASMAGDECRSDRWPERHGPVVRLGRSEEHTSELQSRVDLVCRLLLEKK